MTEPASSPTAHDTGPDGGPDGVTPSGTSPLGYLAGGVFWLVVALAGVTTSDSRLPVAAAIALSVAAVIGSCLLLIGCVAQGIVVSRRVPPGR